MDIAKAAQFLTLMLLPTLLVAAMLHAGQAVRAVRRLMAARHDRRVPQPTHPPIEQLAADLRRLLNRHEAVIRSTEMAMRAHRLRAVEGAIAGCASETAVALGVSCPQLPRRGALPQSEIRRLLHALADAGLVLPPAITLLGSDN